MKRGGYSTTGKRRGPSNSWKLGATLKQHTFKPATLSKTKGKGDGKWYSYSQKMLEQNLKVKSSKRSEIAKVLSDVRALEDRIRVEQRGRDPALAKKDLMHGAVEPPSLREKRDNWKVGSEVEVFYESSGKWLRAAVTDVKKGQECDILNVKITDTDPMAKHKEMEVPRSDQNKVRPLIGNRLRKLTASRQHRHDERLDLYRKVRSAVDMQLQMEVGVVSRRLRSTNGGIYKEITRLIDSLADEKLGVLTMEEIENTWVLIDKKYEVLASNTRGGINDLEEVEAKRKEIVSRTMTTLVKALTNIAHLLPEQIEQLLRSDVWQVNMQIVRNCGWYQELLARMRIEQIRQKAIMKARWKEAKFRWRAFRHKHAISVFHKDMKKPVFSNPPDLRKIFGDLRGTKLKVETECLGIIFNMIKLKPIPYPTSSDEEGVIGLETPIPSAPTHLTPSNVKEGEQNIFKLREEFNKAIDICKAALIRLKEDTDKKARDRLENLRSQLKNIAAHPPEEVNELLETDEGMLPLIKKRFSIAESLFSDTDSALDKHDDFYQKLENICKHYEKVALSWKKHLRELYQREVDTKEDLYQITDEHVEKLELANDSLENRLATEIELLLREPTIEALDERMEKINGLVGPGGEIEIAHKTLNDRSQEKAAAHVPLIQGMAEVYQKSLALMVGLQPKPDEEVTEDEKAEAEKEENGEEEDETPALPVIELKDGDQKKAFSQLASIEALLQRIMDTGSPVEKPKEENAEEEEKKEEEKEGEEGEEVEEEKKEEIKMPTFLDGTPCFNLPVLKNELVLPDFTNNRTSFVQTLVDMHRTWLTESTRIMNKRRDSYAALYDQELRKYRPRIVRVEVDKLDHRREQIQGNMKRFRRHVDRVTRYVKSKERRFDVFLQMIDPKTKKNRVEDFRGTLKDITSEMLKTDKLNVIQTLYNKGNTLYEGLKVLTASTCRSLGEVLEDLKCGADKLGDEFLGSCKLIDAAKSRATTATTEVSSSPEKKSHRTYVKIEYDFYASKSKLMAEEYNTIAAGLEPKIKELGDHVEGLEGFKKFKEEYRELREDLQVMQGLGEKFGAPKREMTMKLRNCYARSAAEEDHITKQLGTLKAILKAANNGKFDLIYPPLSKPVASTVGEQILELFNGLREKLIERAEFLHLLKCDMQASVSPEDIYFVKPEFVGYSEETPEDKEDEEKEPQEKEKKERKRKDIEVEEDEPVEQVKFQTLVETADTGCRAAFGKLIDQHKATRAKQKEQPKDDEKEADEGGVDRTIPDSGLPGPIEAMLKRESDKSKEKLKKYQQIFRQQLEQLENILLEGPVTVYADIITSCKSTLMEEEELTMQTFRKEYKSLSEVKEAHRRRLKPSLANQKNERLRELQAEENKRSKKAVELIRKTRAALMRSEKTQLKTFVKQMMDSCKLLLLIFDSLLHPKDIHPDDARPPARRTLKHLLRHKSRMEKGNQLPKGEGKEGYDPRKFLIVNYAGLKLEHTVIMHTIAGVVKKDDAAAEKIGKPEADEQSKDTEAKEGAEGVVNEDQNVGEGGETKEDTVEAKLSETMKYFKNKCNKMAVRERGNTYRIYTKSLQERCENMLAEVRLAQQDEGMWAKNFAEMCQEMTQA